MIEIKGLRKVYQTKTGDVVALNKVNLTVEAGEFLVLLGPSGSGKTTLLRSVAGLEMPDSGEIRIGEIAVFSSSGSINIPPERRRLGMVFQSYAIWPHKTVGENIALPLQQGWLRLGKAQVRERVARALELVGLEGYETRPAPLLSGGQQQRVALARALAVEPQVMLMDEPLSNLDARLREEVRWEIHSLAKRLGFTVLYVTHDQAEAMALADRIAVMREGDIIQLDTPEALYMRPVHTSVASFFGSMNWIPGEIEGPGLVKAAVGTIRFDGESTFPNQSRVTVGIRWEDIDLTAQPDGNESFNNLPVDVVSNVFLGDHRLYTLKAGSMEVSAKTRASVALTGRAYARIARDRVLVFPEEEPVVEEVTDVEEKIEIGARDASLPASLIPPP